MLTTQSFPEKVERTSFEKSALFEVELLRVWKDQGPPSQALRRCCGEKNCGLNCRTEGSSNNETSPPCRGFERLLFLGNEKEEGHSLSLWIVQTPQASHAQLRESNFVVANHLNSVGNLARECRFSVRRTRRRRWTAIFRRKREKCRKIV